MGHSSLLMGQVGGVTAVPLRVSVGKRDRKMGVVGRSQIPLPSFSPEPPAGRPRAGPDGGMYGQTNG